MNEKPQNHYWRTNLKFLVVLLAIWFAVSAGLSILFVDGLDHFRLGGFKLGFCSRNG
jgi:putative solute:sodium symporter small subunit